VLKELFCGRTETGSHPDVAEAAAKLTEVGNKDRSIQGTTKRTANKRCRGFWTNIDGLIHRCDFGDRDTVVNCI
jgi:hypothetical protein